MLALPVHEEAIEESTRAVEDAADSTNEREKMIVGDEALAKSFVEPRHRLGDQNSTKPESLSWYFWIQWERKVLRPGHPKHIELLSLKRFFWGHICLSVHLIISVKDISGILS